MFTDIQKNNLSKGILMFLTVVSVYFVIKLINEIRAGEYIGTKDTPSTISVSGDGEVFAVPDIATISFTARAEGSTTKIAQTKEAELVNKAIQYLKDNDIAEKDIKTSNYYTSPKYQYTPCTRDFCPANQQKITGYEASQTVDIKIRDIDTAGEILNGLGNVGITEISGPNFSIDNEDGLKDQARDMAIDEARIKAEKLAKSLGVKIVRVTNFQESTGGYPIYFAKDAMMESSNMAGAPASPNIPAGENKINVSVSITYEIK